MKLKDFLEFLASYPQAYPRRGSAQVLLTPRCPSRHLAETSRTGACDRDHLAHAINMAEFGRRLGHKKPGKHPFSNGRTAAARGWRCLTRHPGAI